MQQEARTTTTPLEAFAISLICFGWAIYGSIQSVAHEFQSNGSFNDANLIGLIVTELLVGGIALLILRMRRFDVAALYPAPSLRGVGMGGLLYVAAFFASWLISFVLTRSQEPQPIEVLMSEAKVSLSVLVPLALVNGTFEEIFLLGFLLRGLRGYGLSVALGVSLLIRVLYHLYQGPTGAVYVLVFGFVLSLFYIRTGQLFPAVFAHILGDIVPFM